jgi:GTP-binding protein
MAGAGRAPGAPGATAAEAEDDELEAGRRLFANECRFVGAAASVDGVLAAGPPEVAFAGRSNVGKSSLVNALTGRTTLARTSRTPGRTRQINFFLLGERLHLVDLPGYGYARASKGEIAAWTELLRAYLRGRPTLRRVCLLVDARHGLKPSDLELIALLDQAAVSYQVVLTKADKVPPKALETGLEGLRSELARHPAAHPEITVTSARRGDGIPRLRADLARLAAPR